MSNSQENLIENENSKYWRSLDHKADTPEFREFIDKEFPSGVDLIDDPLSRRNFLKIMSASFALAGLGVTGCRRPEHKILPFSKMPEYYIHGKHQHFATSMPTRQTAVPLLVKSYDGRPIKVEGNPEHPKSKGGTDQYAQASILSLYDPDRGLNFKIRENNGQLRVISKNVVLDELNGLANGKTHILMEQSSSPSRQRLISILKDKGVNLYEYEPVDFSVHIQATSKAFGSPVKPVYKFDKAKIILSLDCDFIGSEESAFENICGFSSGRKVRDDHTENPAEVMNRLYSVEGLLTLTGSNADHRLRVPTGSVGKVAALFLKEVLSQLGEDKYKLDDKIDNFIGDIQNDFKKSHAIEGDGESNINYWVKECVSDLLSLRKKGKNSLVVAGYRQPKEVHLVALIINYLLGNIGSTIVLQKYEPNELGTIKDLEANFSDGDDLVVIGGDPAYNAPVDIKWNSIVEKSKKFIRVSNYNIDLTSRKASAYIPLAHYLESWGDARTSDGTLVSVQPLIAPLFGGITELEVLARIAGLKEVDPYKITRNTFEKLAGSGEEKWEKFLHDGYLKDSSFEEISLSFVESIIKSDTIFIEGNKFIKPEKNKYEVNFYRDNNMDDGRWANNGWLLETPDPLTRISWDNVILVSLQTAIELLGEDSAQELLDFEEVNGKNFDKKPMSLPGRFGFHPESGRFFQKVYKLEVGGRSIEGPIWLMPGMADNVIGVSLGYGRGIGRVGGKAGFSSYKIRTSDSQYIASEATLEIIENKKYEIACVQEQGIMDGRPVIREANAEDFQSHKDFVRHFDLDSESHTKHIAMGGDRYTYEEDQSETIPKSQYVKGSFPDVLGSNNAPTTMDEDRQQWGMVIDLSTCVGCNACVIACQSENNVPIVGKDQVAMGRDMSWQRIDRYFSGDEHNPQVNFQGVSCQHCEDAPCESVCPVNATVHDQEGLNLMAYNRCIGTRYCSNNCPYKVRRFNYYDYNKRPLGNDDGEYSPGTFFNDDNHLDNSPLHPDNKSSNGEWELIRWYKDSSRGSVPGLDDGRKNLVYAGEDDEKIKIKDNEFDPEWDIVKLSKNPDVTVRMRGVMEKCTYCIQRIQQAKINQKVKVRDTVDNLKTKEEKIAALNVPDGTIVPACQQVCPADGVAFGDISDPESEVYRLRRQNRNYSLLGFLDTRPRTTYLAKLRNPNSKMPDYFDIPNSVEEYNKINHGSVFKDH